MPFARYVAEYLFIHNGSLLVFWKTYNHCISPYHYFTMTRIVWTSRFKYFLHGPTSIAFFHWPDMSASCNSAMDFSLGSMFSFRETFATLEVVLSTFIQFSHIFRIIICSSQHKILRALYSVRYSSSWWLFLGLWGI